MIRQIVRVAPALFMLTVLTGTAAQAIETKEGHERAAAFTAKVPLSQAITNAEKQASGKAVSAQIEYSDGKAFYEVTTISGDKRSTATLDPTTGNIMKAAQTSGSTHRHDDKVAAGALARAATSAEMSAGSGKAIKAEYVDMDKANRIQVKVARSSDSVQSFDVDAATGKVQATHDVEHR